MKTALLGFALVGVFATGCGAAVRSPDMFRDDTKTELAKKNDVIKACYDDVLKSTPSAQGKVTVKFEVATETGKLSNVSVDTANTTAPEAVAACVTKSIEGVTVNPPDGNKGEGSWVYDFVSPHKS